MDLGDVTRAMKADPSRRFARKGWNGKHMHMHLAPGKTLDAKDWNDPEDSTGDEEEFGVVKILPHIDMSAADGSRVIGWLAGQTDMLADDRMEV